jgi:hypothetical protein
VQIEGVHPRGIEPPESFEPGDSLHVADHRCDAPDGPLSPVDVDLRGRVIRTRRKRKGNISAPLCPAIRAADCRAPQESPRPLG